MVAWPSGKAEACKASIPSSNLGATFLNLMLSSMLYLVATPIGHLADISFRALNVLKSCEYILCEDTRHSRVLLDHYEIKKPLRSFHKFNEKSKEAEIIADLHRGAHLALITDAGTPGISDPGASLVLACVQQGLKVTSIPGACAAIVALSCSGLDTNRFQFIGFLPRKAGELRQVLQNALTYPGTTISYESPNRLKKVLESFADLAPQRQVVVARELTKKFEELYRGTAHEILTQMKAPSFKGEVVFLISGEQDAKGTQWEDLDPEQHVLLMQDTYGLSRQEAIKMVAELRGVGKRTIYQLMHKK